MKGLPLVAPDGIVVTRAGVVYLSDRAAAGNGFGQIFKLDGSQLKAIVEKVKTGDPAGIALSPDESVLLVSAHQSDNPNDQVLLVNLATLQTGSATDVVGQNHSAAGLHASHGNPQILSWADLTAQGTGTVYRIEFK